MEVQEILLTSKRYIRQSMILSVILYLAGYGVGVLFNIGAILAMPLLVSALYTMCIALIIGMLWQYVSLRQPNMLTTFYNATSGFRMLLALFALTIIYVIVGRDNMMPWAMTFMGFYFVTLAHHSIFFARLKK